MYIIGSDVTERFRLIIFMSLIILIRITQDIENVDNFLWKYFYLTLYVFLGEIIADWIKHAFISKYFLFFIFTS